MRAVWGTATTEEESRAYLQARLIVLLKLMFWSFVALLGFLEVMYRAYPAIEPKHDAWVFAMATGSLVVMAVLWRGLLVRRDLPFAWLHSIDLFFTIGAGFVFGGAGLVSYDFRPSAYTCLTYQCFTLLTRALVVPSTGKRTAIASALSYVPMTTTALVLAIFTQQELPGPAFFTGYAIIGVVCVLLCSQGSRIIYALWLKVTEVQQLGQYKLIRRIGEGGLGAVYLAQHVILQRPTAVKMLLPERIGPDDLARFEREVHAMSELTHPNTVAIYDYGRSAGGLYYAMEYLGGGTALDKLVATYGLQPAARVVPILVQVCGALQEAHDAGLIHHDIKPANIMLCERGGVPDVAKVVDFGLVTAITDSATPSQIVLGTPAYIAPETMTNPSAIGPAIDLYALGCVGYFLLTGRAVFTGTPRELCAQHVAVQPKRPSEVIATYVPEDLEAVIMKCLEKQPADRYASAAALADALLALAPQAGWSEADAQQWWRAFQPGAIDPASSLSMITVDVGQRLDEASASASAP